MKMQQKLQSEEMKNPRQDPSYFQFKSINNKK